MPALLRKLRTATASSAEVPLTDNRHHLRVHLCASYRYLNINALGYQQDDDGMHQRPKEGDRPTVCVEQRMDLRWQRALLIDDNPRRQMVNRPDAASSSALSGLRFTASRAVNDLEDEKADDTSAHTVRLRDLDRQIEQARARQVSL
jgi:hypothetical protein